MLRAAGVSFGYDENEVLTDTSIEVPTGRLVGVIGPNGSGKTTLLHLLSGLLTPSRGQVSLDGIDLSTLSRPRLARHMAMVPQDTEAAFDYSVLEIVLMGRYPHLGTFGVEGADDYREAERALAATGTADLRHRRFRTLSGGEKQRVVIASALAQLTGAETPGPRILLLDEPTASLDLAYQLEIEALVRSLHAGGATVVLSTHDLNLAAAVCEELVLLRQGRVLASGPTDVTLTEENIQALYDVDVRVTSHAAGGRSLVVPLARVG